MSKDDADRMESNYDEAVALIKNCKSGLIKLVNVVEVLVGNVVDRMVWIEEQNTINKAEASAKGLPAPEPLNWQTEINNLERLARLVVILNNPSSGLQDDNEAQRSMLAMIAMLKEARAEYGDGKDPDAEEIKEAIEKETASVNDEFDKRFAPSTDSHRRCEQRNRN